MANWRYEGLDRGGGSSSGTVTAPDRGTAMRMVLSRGLTPLRLESDDSATDAPTRRAEAASAP
jgi:type II secretory pathway component PulF